MNNLALVNERGNAPRLASTRVAGKPYTVSEYNHPQPLTHAAEGFPMIAAFGAFQGWSAIYSFDYSGSNVYEPDKLDGYFDIKSDPSRTPGPHAGLCGALPPGRCRPCEADSPGPLAPRGKDRQLRDSRSAWTLTTDRFGVDAGWSLVHAIGLDLKAENSAGPGQRLLPATKSFLSDTGQLRWDVSRPGAGYFTADTPRTSSSPGSSADARSSSARSSSNRFHPAGLGDGHDDHHRGSSVRRARPDPDRGHGVGPEQGSPASNGGETHHPGNRWGEAPVLCEGIAAEIVLPVPGGRATIYPLDTAGNRRAAVKPTDRDGWAVSHRPRYRTLWYEVEIH